MWVEQAVNHEYTLTNKIDPKVVSNGGSMKPFLILAFVTPFAACTAPQPAGVGLANPASVHCKAIGGTTEIRKQTDGEAGYCHLPDGSVVDEWELFRATRGA